MSDLAAEAAALNRWLFDTALPLWWQQGADHVRGGFHEAISLDGRPLPLPHRARVIARQAFSYCEAGRPCWHGHWPGGPPPPAPFFSPALLPPPPPRPFPP